MKIKKVKISDIKFDNSNPNIMDEDEKRRLSESIKEFGYIEPVVIDEDSYIVSNGQHRVEELIKKGVKEIEVVLVKFKSDNERRLFRLASNKIHGKHDPSKDAVEFLKLVDAGKGNLLQMATGLNMQQIKNQIDKQQEDAKKVLKEKIHEVDQLGSIQIECPSCGFKFSKKRD